MTAARPPAARPGPAAPWPRDEAVLGVIEGFYGQPWSWAERRRMVEFMAGHGFGLYVHAPKDDPLHRLQWRDRHLPEELGRFERLAARCDALGIRFAAGIHPLDLGDGAADADLLYEKAHSLQEAGVRELCVLFDDLPLGAGRTPRERTASARRHARIANRLLARLRAAGPLRGMTVAPTEYHGGGKTPYVRALGAALDPGIDVFWTGPEVCSARITGPDLEGVAEALRRPPLVWDNYPVNDGDMRFDPHIRPFRGRTAEARRLARGFVANPAGQPEASRIALHTLGDWWADPDAYDPDEAWDRALLAVGGSPEDAAALRIVGELTRRSALEPGRHPVPALERFRRVASGWAAADEREREAAAVDIMAETSRWGEAARRLLHGPANTRLAMELAPWARKLAAWADLVADAPALLASGSGRSGAAARRAALARLERVRRDPRRVSDEEMDGFVREVLWLAMRGGSRPSDPA